MPQSAGTYSCICFKFHAVNWALSSVCARFEFVLLAENAFFGKMILFLDAESHFGRFEEAHRGRESCKDSLLRVKSDRQSLWYTTLVFRKSPFPDDKERIPACCLASANWHKVSHDFTSLHFKKPRDVSCNATPTEK